MPIDGVRAITNSSTGATGAELAAHFAGAGYDVTLLHAVDAVLPERGGAAIELQPFTTYDDLAEQLRRLLPTGHYDAVVHLAAVSDYEIGHIVVDGVTRPADPGGKLDSAGSVQLLLTRTEKLLPTLKSLAGGRAIIVGFKLTSGASTVERDAAVASVANGTDLVVHNDVSDRATGSRRATLYRVAGGTVEDAGTVADNRELAIALEREIAVLLSAGQNTVPRSAAT